MHQFRFLQVESVERQTRDAVVVTFDVPASLQDEFRYLQGQHLTLRREFDGEELRRSYSICSAVQDQTLRVAIKRVPGGLFSNWANDELAPGVGLDVMPPSGRFRVDLAAPNAKHYVAFVAGSGITPILSIIKTTLMTEPGSRFTLFYGNRSASSVLFKEELEDLKDRYIERFRLVFILSREQLDIDLFNGRIDRERVDALMGLWLDPADIDVAFVCGPLDMMNDVSEGLQAHGVPKADIKMELFATSAQDAARRQARSEAVRERPVEGESRIDVILDGRTRVLSVERGRQNLIDAALEQSVALPYSCKAGVCSSCRCKVVAGEVDMNAVFALEDYEIERGFVLACQSYPVSDRVVLDFDQET